MSQDDKFKNYLSLTVVRDEGLCEGKELGCTSMTITGLGELFFGKEEGSTTYGAEFTREPRPEDPKVLPDVELTGLRSKSKIYCIGAIRTMD